MAASAGDFETSLVDLSDRGLYDVMAIHDPVFADALDGFVRDLGANAASQNNNGSGVSPYSVVPCDAGDL